MQTVDANRNDANKNDEVVPTHDVFLVEEREGGRRPHWRKVGLVFTDGEGDVVVMLPEVDGSRLREVLLVQIDRARRPIGWGRDPKRCPTHELFTGYWKGRKRVGAAWTNKDGSLSLVVDEGVREAPKVRYQMREVRTRAG